MGVPLIHRWFAKVSELSGKVALVNWHVDGSGSNVGEGISFLLPLSPQWDEWGYYSFKQSKWLSNHRNARLFARLWFRWPKFLPHMSERKVFGRKWTFSFRKGIIYGGNPQV